MTLAIVPRICISQIYRNGYPRPSAANEKPERIFHSDDGPVLEDDKSDLYVKIDIYAFCDYVTRSLNSSVGYTRSLVDGQQLSICDHLLPDALRISRTEASLSDRVAYAEEWPGQEV